MANKSKKTIVLQLVTHKLLKTLVIILFAPRQEEWPDVSHNPQNDFQQQEI